MRFADALRAMGVPMLGDPPKRKTAASGVVASAGPPINSAKNWSPTGGVDVFVGGGADHWPLPGFGVVRRYAEDHRKDTGRPVQYIPHNEQARILESVRRAQGSGPVNVVAHSWGGPTAYRAVAEARRQGLRVDNLITLDPAGYRQERGFGEQGPNTWMNVKATSPKLRLDDIVEYFGGQNSKLPIDQDADRQAEVRAHHGDIEQMMQASGARALLDSSRRGGAR
jgi:pimeloyl-ACP methyl ester carboxylesterase